MKLYFHPASTTCRPIMQFAAESGLALEYELVDLMSGQQTSPEFAAINPSQAVPALVDGAFQLAESSAILKYLADKIQSPTYPTDAKLRATVNARMDWFNTGFYRDYACGLVYPQILPGHRRADAAAQDATIEWGRGKAKRWLTILDERLIGPERAWLVGDHHTIADFFGAGVITLGEVIRLDLSPYPNVQRWLGNVKALPSWGPATEAFYAHFVAAYRDAEFVGL